MRHTAVDIVMANKKNEPDNPQSNDAETTALRSMLSVIQTSTDLVFLVGKNNIVIDANAYASNQLGLSSRELVGRPLEQFIFERPDEQTIATQSAHDSRWFLRRKNGTTLPVEFHFNRLPTTTFVNDLPARTIAVVKDISEQRAYQEKILRLAHFDAVTGLINRSLLEDRAEQALTRAKRHTNLMAFLFVDLDRFKEVNDELGHHVGDRLLKAVGMRIQSVLRDNDTLGRLGGDEFLIIAEEIKYTDDAMLIGSKIINTISEAFGIEGHVIHISASIGIAMYPDHGESAFQLIHNADKAMYRAKELGRNNLAVYNPSLKPQRS